MKKTRYARWILRKNLDEAHAAAARLERGSSRAAVHALRVALRRNRTLMKALKPFLDFAMPAGSRRSLRRFRRALGDARDFDIFRKNLGSSSPATARSLRAAERSAYASVRRSLPTFRAFERSLRLRLGPAEEPGAPSRAYRRWARRWMLHRVKRIRRSLAVTSGPKDRRLHRARIQAKKIRYVAETMPDVRAAERVARRARQAQDALGDIHDLAALEAYLRSRAAPAARRTRLEKEKKISESRRFVRKMPRWLEKSIQKLE